MTREEEIHEAAKEFAFSDKTETPDLCDVINDFYYGAKWADKTMLDRACEWLKNGGYFVNSNETIEDFRKAMEGGAE